MFETVPSEGQRCDLIHCFGGDMRERDSYEGMRGIKERNNVSEG
jgi:hypothetical protein